jgi:hypothetical protein
MLGRIRRGRSFALRSLGCSEFKLWLSRGCIFDVSQRFLVFNRMCFLLCRGEKSSRLE